MNALIRNTTICSAVALSAALLMTHAGPAYAYDTSMDCKHQASSWDMQACKQAHKDAANAARNSAAAHRNMQNNEQYGDANCQGCSGRRGVGHESRKHGKRAAEQDKAASDHDAMGW